MIDENISKRIFERADSMEYNYFFYTSFFRFTVEIHPLSFMPEEDFYNDVYDAQLREARDRYCIKYEKEFLQEQDEIDLRHKAREEKRKLHQRNSVK